MVQRYQMNEQVSNHKKSQTLPLKYFMTDIIDVVGELTNDVKNAYELKGLANSLTLENVLDTFESCVKVSCPIDKDPEVSDDDVIATSTIP
jgi:hypothetical protein